MARETFAIIFTHWFAGAFAVNEPMVEQPWIALPSPTTWVSMLKFGGFEVFPVFIGYFLQCTACLTILHVPIQRQALHAKSRRVQRAGRWCWNGQCTEQVPKGFAMWGQRPHGEWANVLQCRRWTTLYWFSVKEKTLNGKPENEAVRQLG